MTAVAGDGIAGESLVCFLAVPRSAARAFQSKGIPVIAGGGPPTLESFHAAVGIGDPRACLGCAGVLRFGVRARTSQNLALATRIHSCAHAWPTDFRCQLGSGPGGDPSLAMPPRMLVGCRGCSWAAADASLRRFASPGVVRLSSDVPCLEEQLPCAFHLRFVHPLLACSLPAYSRRKPVREASTRLGALAQAALAPPAAVGPTLAARSLIPAEVWSLGVAARALAV